MDIVTSTAKLQFKERDGADWHLYFNEKKTTMKVPKEKTEEESDTEDTEEEVEAYQYYHVLIKHSVPTIGLYKRSIVKTIEEYDKSDAVRTFNLSDGTTAYIERDTRVSLDALCTAKLEQGEATMELWLHNTKYTVDIKAFISFLKQLEIYASDCFNTTQMHIQNVYKADKFACSEYDFTIGYPEKLTFNVNQ